MSRSMSAVAGSNSNNCADDLLSVNEAALVKLSRQHTTGNRSVKRTSSALAHGEGRSHRRDGLETLSYWGKKLKQKQDNERQSERRRSYSSWQATDGNDINQESPVKRLKEETDALAPTKESICNSSTSGTSEVVAKLAGHSTREHLLAIKSEGHEIDRNASHSQGKLSAQSDQGARGQSISGPGSNLSTSCRTQRDTSRRGTSLTPECLESALMTRGAKVEDSNAGAKQTLNSNISVEFGVETGFPIRRSHSAPASTLGPPEHAPCEITRNSGDASGCKVDYHHVDSIKSQFQPPSQLTRMHQMRSRLPADELDRVKQNLACQRRSQSVVQASNATSMNAGKRVVSYDLVVFESGFRFCVTYGAR
jgi:hypothetical protein